LRILDSGNVKKNLRILKSFRFASLHFGRLKEKTLLFKKEKQAMI